MRTQLVVLICMFSIAAQGQSWQATYTPNQPFFEVSASTYAWEVHDEGIDRVLDNMQQMAGVNSVYLIALMHHEPRPFTCERFPHNPVRQKWFAEDSRLSWHPDLTLYGRIKPQVSDHAWLNGTDWLKVVIQAARQRKMKVGVEVSHTIMSKQLLQSDSCADLVQRNLSGAPAAQWSGRYLPCPNHPDVQAYLVALYTDLAKNYDLDYIQTCMLNFAMPDIPDGGCFCTICLDRAGKAGLDTEAMMKAFRRDPAAQPDLDRWQAFRRKSVTALYRKIIDTVHQVNPGIEFRLNHFTRSARKGGLYIEDIAPMLNSIRLMSYEEQSGDPGRLQHKRSWIRETRERVGEDLPVLAALGVRNKAYPALIRQGVAVAVESGVQGITLGHYDGAAHSILRAVREGMVQAGVPGIRPAIGVEAERMRSDNYFGNPWLYETCVNTDGVGTLHYTFDQKGGDYRIRVSYADEKGGDGKISVFVNDKLIDSWLLDRDIDCWTTHLCPEVRLRKGDQIKLEGRADGQDWARIDYVEFVPSR